MDYETLEIYLGERLNASDCLDIHSDEFFPVSLLRQLFHYSEESRPDGAPVNYHGHDFDRWVDNCVAATRLHLINDKGDERQVTLVDIDGLEFVSDGTIKVILPDETEWTLLIEQGEIPLTASSLSDLDFSMPLEEMFKYHPVDDDSEGYTGFGVLAHLIRVVCERSGIDPAVVDQRQLSERIFAHFKDELLPLIPVLWNDMEHIEHYTHPSIVARHDTETTPGEK